MLRGRCRGRGGRAFRGVRRDVPLCCSGRRLHEVVPLARGIPLRDPVDGKCYVNLSEGDSRARGDRIYHPEGSGGGATLGPLALGEPAGFGGVGW